MESNQRIVFNWGAFNIPTILAIASVGWLTATKQERQDARLDAIELQQTARAVEVNKLFEAMQVKTVPVDNLVYRVTSLETGLNEANRRMDRVGDSFQGVRDDISGLSTKFEVLSQKVELVLPGNQAAARHRSAPPDR